MMLYDPCPRVARTTTRYVWVPPFCCFVKRGMKARGAIEEGSNQRQLQARNCLYQCIQKMSFNVQKALRNACQRSIGLINFSNIN